MDQPDFYFQGIYLGGFQVFDEVTFIPLSRLNLLFGPNSAGKSAVEDALNLVHQEFFASEVYQYGLGFLNLNSRFSFLNRHWRRLSEEGGSFAPELTLGVRFASDVHLIGALENYLKRPTPAKIASAYKETPDFYTIAERYLAKQQPSSWADTINPFLTKQQPSEWSATIDLLVKYRIRNVEEIDCVESINLERDFVFVVNGQWVAEYKDRKLADIMDSKDSESYFQLNFSHPIFIGYQPAVDFEQISNRYPDIFQFDEGVVRFSHAYAESLLYENIQSKSFYYGESLALGGLPSELESVVEELKIYYHSLHSLVMGNRRFEILPNVPASRTIPSKEDLCFLKVDDDDLIDQFCLRDHGDPRYLKLAWNVEVMAKVNQMLTEHLFTERGYFIGSESLNVIPDNTTIAATLKRLFLVDAQGRKLSFNEVGSGLGYVLPVLCGVCDVVDGSFSLQGFLFIQQPELHLHPALQAALGDVFIECSPGRQVVIETHSEHLLLRILKRIRQTCSSRPPVPELQIKPEDVSILYFDPSPTGVTHVRRIRIGEDGDFLDRWPRGFFGERDQELFDE